MNNHFEAKNKEEFQTFLKNNKYVIVDFFATWCPPCQVLGGILDKILRENLLGDKVKLLKVNVDLATEVAMMFGITSMPTMVLIQGEKEVNRFVGLRPESDILEIAKNSFDSEANIS